MIAISDDNVKRLSLTEAGDVTGVERAAFVALGAETNHEFTPQVFPVHLLYASW